MSEEQIQVELIDRYTTYQRIKKANKGHKNKVLDYEIKVTAEKLYVFGIDVDELKA